MVELNRKHNLSTVPSIDNDGNAYVIPLDIYKEGYQAYDISNWFKGRVGDNGTPFAIRWYSHGRLLNIQGKRPFIEGQVGDYTIDDSDPDNPQITMAEDAANIHVVGDVTDTQEGGIAIYRLISQAFPKSGIFYGKIGFMGVQDDGTLANTGVDIVFKVLAGHMNMLGARQFYVSELEKAWLDLQEKIRQYDQQYKDQTKQQAEQFKQDTEKALADLNTKIANEIKRAEDTLGDTQASIDSNIASLKTLSATIESILAKIQASDLITIKDYDAREAVMDNKIEDKLKLLRVPPEAYPTFNDIKAKYPDGPDGRWAIALDTNHKWVYSNGQWQDAGEYSTANIADDSISDAKFAPKSLFSVRVSQNMPIVFENAKGTKTVEKSVKKPDGTTEIQKVTEDASCWELTVLNNSQVQLYADNKNFVFQPGTCKLDNQGNYWGYITYVPNAKAEAQFKYYAQYRDIPEDEYYIGWINTIPNTNTQVIKLIVNVIHKNQLFAGTDDPLKWNQLSRLQVPSEFSALYTESGKWLIDYKLQNLHIPNFSVIYKNTYFWHAATDLKLPSKAGYLYVTFNADVSIDIHFTSNQGDVPEQALFIGIIDCNQKLAYIKDYGNLNQPADISLISTDDNNKINVDFINKKISFPKYSFAVINGISYTIRNSPFTIDLKLNDTGELRESTNHAYFIAINPNKLDDFKNALYITDDCNNISGYSYLGWVYLDTQQFDFGINGNSQQVQPFGGRAITCIGDSITQGQDMTGAIYPSYVPRMAKYLGTTPTNTGVGGATIAKSGDLRRQPFSAQIANVKDQDVITIFGGTNDFAANDPIGKITDTDESTFYGGLNNLIQKLTVQNPNAKFLLITQMKANVDEWKTYDDNRQLRKNDIGLTALDYVNAVKAIGSFYSIPVLDLFNEANFNPAVPAWFGEDSFCKDGLHPTPKGDERLAKTIAARINLL